METFFKARSIPVSFRIAFIGLLGIIFCLIGAAGIVLSIIELFHGRPSVSHYDESHGGLKVENPLWPSSGKGFWVGLVLLVTGLVGILASREWTPPSIFGFTALAGASTILSFYLMITCIIPVHYDTKYSDTSRPRWQLNELSINSLLIAVGGFGTILGAISTLVGSYFIGCCVNQRDKNDYIDEPNRIAVLPLRGYRRGGPNIRPREGF
ncbi:unnamed protein product [Rotaria sp. Silwood2]|nr:unnamed protein product [Rotaria sp. Silwood2]CAF2726384.1 unnamed protein product [Rotaria sp. Silwood2]CAF3064274.1 unnamed protein product [Rotaria sp. Silwood2]CAF3968698.1 unnamed protein product [Rotaria sp. Silwood2]CAF4054502.1 unnamed protein product [Rotaria sp. Silwood2]